MYRSSAIAPHSRVQKTCTTVYERWVQQAESDFGSMIGADGALYAIRRELFVPPSNDTILDDMAIPMAVIRAGRRVVFEASARAYEQGSETAAEEFARKSRVVAGSDPVPGQARQLDRVWVTPGDLSLLSHKGLRWLSPAFATCAFVASAALMGVSSLYAAAAVFQGPLLVLGLFGCCRPAPQPPHLVGALLLPGSGRGGRGVHAGNERPAVGPLATLRAGSVNEP